MGHRGKRGGKRGSEFNKSVKLESRKMLDTGSTAGVVATGKRGYTPAMNIHFENDETTLYADEGLTPRKSLSAQQHLSMVPQVFETETIRGKQINRRGLQDGETLTYEDAVKRLIEVTSERVAWKSDKTLLKKGKVDQMPAGFKRTTSRSKRQEWIEEPTAPEGSLSWVKGDETFSDPILSEMKIEPAKS